MKPNWKGKEITKALKALALEAESVTDSGDTITRAEALALLLWKRALGYKELKPGREGVMQEVIHDSEAWAMTFVTDRLEGKVANAAPDEASNKPTTAARVSDLAKNRINAILSAPVKSGPPSLKRNSDGNA